MKENSEGQHDHQHAMNEKSFQVKSLNERNERTAKENTITNTL